jgi:hypothetical protein
MVPATRRTLRIIVGALALVLLSGCATKSMPGYQDTFKGYSVPESLVESIRARFKSAGLTGADVTRDSVGRIRLVGRYANEDEVDSAFIIVQTLVGLKASSPFYPQDVAERRWEQAASQALKDYASRQRRDSPVGGAGVRRALVIGINTFRDPDISAVQGEDDARTVAARLSSFGFKVTPLFGADATKGAIEQAIAQLRRDLKPNDELFIYVSSHGAPPLPSPRGGDERKMSIVAYDTGYPPGQRARDGVEQALQIQRTSVKDTLLQDLAQQPTRYTRVMVDTCYSGEMLRDVPASSRQFIQQQNGGAADKAGVSLAAWTGPAFAPKAIKLVGGPAAAPARAADVKAPTTPTTAPAWRQGYTVITATSEGELAYGPDIRKGTFASPVAKDAELKGSFFTQTLMAWLELNGGQIQPAFDRASEFTRQTVMAQGLKQTPRLASTLSPEDDYLKAR